MDYHAAYQKAMPTQHSQIENHLTHCKQKARLAKIARREDCLEDGSLKKLPGPTTIKSTSEMHVASV